MSSIGTLSNSPYYQLSNPSGGAGAGITATPTLADAMLQALSPSPSPSAFGDSAFMLDLSPQAQQLLNNINAGIPGGSPLDGSGSFTLSTQQQQQVATILAKYKDAPYTQDTFNQIQNDLNAAGLGPDLLAMQDQAKSFDPAMVLIDALNGTTGDTGLLGGGATGNDEQAKSGAYMQQIIKQWQGMSSTYQASSAVTPAGAGGGA